MVEFALVVPLLLTMIFFSLYFCELVHARLTLQEASRFAAWEMTSYPLDGYGKKDTGSEQRSDDDKAFKIAQKDVTDRTKKMFVDMDSVEPGTSAASNLFASYKPVTVTITGQKVGQKDATVQMGALGSLVGAANRGLGDVLGFWGFNPNGVVQVDVSTEMSNMIVPQHYLDGSNGFFETDQWGGKILKGLKLHNRYTLVASSWALGDGGDASAGDDIAGSSEDDDPSAMWYQVKRMSFLGLSAKLESLPGVKQITGGLSKLLPNLLGTYVVDHAYRHNGMKGYRKPGNEDRGCETGNASDPARSGLTNVAESPGLDFEYGKCFDTLPFRDRQGYNQSQAVQMFNHRGQYFMGCENEEVDDPAWPTLDLTGDKDNRQPRLDCETSP